MRLNHLTLTLLLIILAYSAIADISENAKVSVFVFLKGSPLANIVLYENHKKIGTTDIYGNVVLSFTAGKHLLVLRNTEHEIYQKQLTLSENEIMQLLVDIKVKGQEPSIDIETSKQSNHNNSKNDQETIQPQDQIITTLSGTILSIEDHTGIANARVYISGISDNITSDKQGRFSLKLPTGTYNISVLHAQYNSTIKSNVNIGKKGLSHYSIEMTPAGTELPEFVVVMPYIEGSLASVLEERKQNNSVANYLSMEQISKSGDSDAAGALKRVTGLTLVDGKFIFVRGLGERYSSTLLNGANLPSPDPTRRVVPLDLFPTGIIESIEVQKGYSVNLPAEFGGGSVTLKTIDIPQNNFLKLGVSYANNSQTTGKKGLHYAGGGSDWTGYDDGTRAIPAPLLAAIQNGTELRPSNPFVSGGIAPQELEAIGESLSDNYSLTNISIDPGVGINLSGGMRKDLSSGIVLGFSSAFEYSSDYQTRNELRRDYVISTGDNLALESQEDTSTTNRNINLSGFFTSGIEFNKDNKISANYMVLRNTQNFNEIAQGYNDGVGTSRQIFELRWTERELASMQLFGDHSFTDFHDLNLKWQYTDSTATFYEPDNRIYRYDQRPDGTFTFSSRNDSNSRVWRSLKDLSKDIHYDISLPISINSNHDLLFLFGQSWIKKDRNSDIRRFVFEDVGPLANQVNRNGALENILSPEFIDPRGYQLIELTRATDNYFANLDIKSSYLGIDYSYKKRFKFSIGVRQEDFQQSVLTFRLFDPNQSPIEVSLNDKNLFPAFSSTFFLPADNQIKLNYAQTATRPDFKELSPAQFRDPVLNRNVIGNPNLITGQIEHYDLRWDKYFSAGEFISVSLFYKNFINPIELTILPGSARIISFQNALSATNSGIEFELYKDLSFVDRVFDSNLWSNFYISANYAYIKSQINLDTNLPGGQTNNTRALQGQSPYVANIQLGYDNPDKNTSLSLLFNVFGERISEAGTSGRPDVYEQPFNQLDLVYSQKLFGKLSIGFKAKNLLNDEVLFLVGDETARSFSKGRSFSIGLKYDIF